MPRPVEWIGWWLTTPLEQCKAWALRRDRPVPEAVIEEFHASLNHKTFKPDRSEGFAVIVALNPAAGEGDTADLSRPLAALDGRIRNSLNRQRSKDSQCHRYSRLLDLERLLFLIRLLTSFNGLDENDPGTASALLQICNPPPQGDLAERAAAYLASWKEVHGGNSDGYGDAAAIRGDLAWLESNGFFRLDWQGDPPIQLAPAAGLAGSSVHGGSPALADPATFRRVFTLLRHILKEPFDAPDPSESAPARDAATPARRKRSKRSSNEFGPLYRHLLERLGDIEGAYAPDQEAVLRYDLEHALRPYGFLPQVKGRPHSLRQGYAIGTALLSADQLLEVHALLKASLDRLSDQSQKPLLLTLEDRLRRAGLLDAAGVAPRLRHAKRALAHRSFTEEKPGTLADPQLTPRLERTVRDRRRVWLRHLPDPIDQARRNRGDDGRFRAWPLQLLFHNISWYLAFETFHFGRSDGFGLIRTLRLDRLVLLSEDGNARRSSDAEHNQAMERLQRLLHVCGGLYFGDSIQEQLAVVPQGRQQSEPGLLLEGADPYGLLRFSCTAAVFRLIREEPHRFPPEHFTYSRPVISEADCKPGPGDNLAPNPAGDSHPYPVEIRLPRWTLQHDWDLRTWLFRWGAGIRIEQPESLRQQQLQQARAVVDLYAD